MNHRTIPINHAVTWIQNQYEYFPQHRIKYYLSHQEMKENGKYIFHFTHIHHRHHIKASWEEVLLDKKILPYISHHDFQIMFSTMLQIKQKPQIKIKMQKFSDKLNKMIFVLQTRGKKKISEKTADQISLDKNILNSLSQREAHLVGYTVAMEHQFELDLQISQLSQQKSNRDSR